MAYFFLIFVAAITAVFLLNIRIRLEFSKDSKLLFVGLGRTGPEIDLLRNEGIVKLWGRKVKRFEVGKEKREIPPKAKKKKEKLKRAVPKKTRKRSPRDIVKVGRKSIKPLWAYIINLLKAVGIEELEGCVEAGFEEPHLTGMMFGYYQAALAAVPNVVGRVQFTPVWTGASFSGSAKVAVALPLYKFAGRTAQLLWRLPLREIIKLAIGKKEKGESDVQQRGRDTQGRSQRAA